MTGRTGDCRQGRALILVRNTVHHDARVLREAEALEELGLEVLIAGVLSTRERERRLTLEGHEVVRLDPGGWIRRAASVVRLPRRASDRGATPGLAPSAAAVASGPAHGPRATLRRVVLAASYYLQGTALAWRTSPTLVHANDYNTMWIALGAKLIRGSRVVYDSHELWADRNRRPEWRPWLVACEALFVRLADHTITTSPGYADELARRYRVARPVVVRNIPAGARVDAGLVASPDPHHPVVAYVGGLMPGRGLEQAIRALQRAPELELRLVGPGNDAYRRELQRLASEEGVADRVELRAPVAPSELLGAVKDAAAGLMLIEPVCRSYELTLPNKLFEYAAAGLPILASDVPVLAGVVRDEGLGQVVAVDDTASVAAGMRTLADPIVNQGLRERVCAFSARESWERERTVLESVYRDAVGGDRVGRAYRRYGASAHKRRSWSADNRGNAAIRAELVAAVMEMSGASARRAGRILDAGCGSGWWLQQLAATPEIGASLHGVDLLPDRVEAAKKRVPQATVVVGDVRRLPYESGRFEVVSLFTVLSSMASRRDITQAVREGVRVLAPGGVLIIWEPRLPNPVNRATLLVRERLVRDASPGSSFEVRMITLLPPLARRLGTRTESLYPRLARVEALRSHRLICVRPCG